MSGLTTSLQPTCYPYGCSTVNEDRELLDSSSRHGDARTRLNSALGARMEVKQHACILILAAALASGCGQDPVVTAARKRHRDYVGTEPKAADVVGTYVLSDQTVVPGGVSAVGGRHCRLDVFADGTFSIKNYPRSSGGRFSSFQSTTGTWRLATIGTSYGYGPNPKECWGFQFYGAGERIDPTAFTGPEQPYGLLTILGDPDSNRTIRFKRKKHPTKAPSSMPGTDLKSK